MCLFVRLGICWRSRRRYRCHRRRSGEAEADVVEPAAWQGARAVCLAVLLSCSRGAAIWLRYCCRRQHCAVYLMVQQAKLNRSPTSNVAMQPRPWRTKNTRLSPRIFHGARMTSTGQPTCELDAKTALEQCLNLAGLGAHRQDNAPEQALRCLDLAAGFCDGSLSTLSNRLFTAEVVVMMRKTDCEVENGAE